MCFSTMRLGRSYISGLKRLLSTRSTAEPFYITTPIFYVNGEPHLGHAYSLIVADTYARFHRMAGKQVHFLTGTDEFGQKVEQTAKLLGKSSLEFADENSAKFRSLATQLGCSHNDFIRTTEERHINTVINIWKTLEKSGYLYEGVYEGWYSVRDETFYAADELIEGKAPTGADVVWVKEDVYFFRLSFWRKHLQQFYRSNATSIFPDHRKSEILNMLSDEVNFADVCVSRRNITWGIPVPSDKSQIIYVWLDALTNYLTALGYDPLTDEQSGLMLQWPPNVQIVGKDILRFHALLWPALLLSLNLSPPRTIVAHGWWTKDGIKMSKSVGNVVNPSHILSSFGSDCLRFFLLSEVPLGGDGDFNFDNFVTRINSHLSDNLGNLTQRVLTMVSKHCDKSMIPVPTSPLSLQDEELLRECDITFRVCSENVQSHQLHRMVESILRLCRLCNKYMDNEAPWKLRKTDVRRMETVLYVLLESLRKIALLLEPVTPLASASILNQLSVPLELRNFASFSVSLQSGQVISLPAPLFPKRERHRGST